MVMAGVKQVKKNTLDTRKGPYLHWINADP